MSSDSKDSLWNSSFFYNSLLQRSPTISDLGSPVPMMLICLIIGYILVFITISKGISTSSKVVYVTALGPYLFLFFLLGKGLSLPGSVEGVKFLFIPDWSSLFTLKIWKDAIV